MIFDTHAHYDDEAFDEDRESLLQGMKQNGVDCIVNIGANMQTSRNTVALTEQYDFIYGAVGVHPSDVYDMTEADLETLREWSRLDKIVAIGEIGLDYHYPDTDKALQQKWFIRQLQLAREEKLPVVIHSRDAAADTLAIMQEHGRELGGVIHCFSYTKETAKIFLDMDFSFGIGGVITFKNAKKLKEAVEYIPMDKIVIETDCPYLSPEPNRGKRNSSLNLPYVIKAIAELKNLSEEEVLRATYENAKKIYRIND